MTKTYNEPVEFESEVRHKVLPHVFVDKLQPSSAEPSVQNVTVFLAGGIAVTILNFRNGQEGQRIDILGDGLTTVQDNADISNLGGINNLLVVDTIYTYILINNVWYQLFAGGGGGRGNIIVSIDGAGSVITAGVQRTVEFKNLAGIITGAVIIGDVAGGSCELDVWRDDAPTFPVLADAITGTALPTLVADTYEVVNVTSWLKTFAANSIFTFVVNSNSLHTKITLTISYTKTV